MTGSGHHGRGSRARVAAVSDRATAWADQQDPTSRKGVAVESWRRYRAVDGPLQSALLSLYTLVAVLPAVLVMEEYLDAHPAALANRLVQHYGLNAATASLLRSLLGNTRTHELGSALFAVAGALFFGLSLGRVLQLVHARAWRVTLPTHRGDQAMYAGVLLGFYGLILLLLLQLTELHGAPRWVAWLLGVGWMGLLVLFFVWMPWLLLHRQVSRRALVPGAVLSSVGIVGLMFVSSVVMEYWVNLYARDYGGLGVVLAIYFWLAFSSFVVVAAAAIAPALAQRRELAAVPHPQPVER